jgi:hypothetical protein
MVSKQCRPAGRNVVAVPTNRSLSPNQCFMLAHMWRMGFGTIRGLHVRGGDLLLDPPFISTPKVRLTEDRWLGHESANADYTLKREQIRFLEELRFLGTGVVDITVHGGLPVALEIHKQQ